MRSLPDVDSARAVLDTFHLIYHVQPDGTIRDAHGREAFDRTIQLVTDAMAALS
jgi:hypothetical protein